jgi:hypothetical protein
VRSEVNVSEVIAKVHVRQDLDSSYRLHPPLHTVPIFRMRIKVSIIGQVTWKLLRGKILAKEVVISELRF